MLKQALVAAATLTALTSTAFAATDADWAQFRQQVSTACTTAAQPLLGATEASVDPHGSDSYGLAVVHSVTTPNLAVICVYDKRTAKVELGSEMMSQPRPAAHSQATVSATQH